MMKCRHADLDLALGGNWHAIRVEAVEPVRHLVLVKIEPANDGSDLRAMYVRYDIDKNIFIDHHVSLDDGFDAKLTNSIIGILHVMREDRG